MTTEIRSGDPHLTHLYMIPPPKTKTLRLKLSTTGTKIVVAGSSPQSGSVLNSSPGSSPDSGKSMKPSPGSSPPELDLLAVPAKKITPLYTRDNTLGLPDNPDSPSAVVNRAAVDKTSSISQQQLGTGIQKVKEPTMADLWFKGYSNARHSPPPSPNAAMIRPSGEKFLAIAEVFLKKNQLNQRLENGRVTAEIYQSFQESPDSEHREIFFRRIPLANEGHFHLGGGLYRSTILRLAAKNGLWMDPKTCLFYPNRDTLGKVSAIEMRRGNHETELKEFIRMTTLKGCPQKEKPGHFHRTFDPIESVMKHMTLTELVTPVVRQKLIEGTQNMELMIDIAPRKYPKTFKPHASALDSLAIKLDLEECDAKSFCEDLEEKFEAAFASLKDWAEEYVKIKAAELEQASKEVAQNLHLRVSSITSNASSIRVIYIPEVMRTISHGLFFAQMVASLQLCKKFPHLAGSVTIDGHERAETAMVMWPFQQRILNFLFRKLDKPNITPHVAEWIGNRSESLRIQDCLPFSRRLEHASGIVNQHDPQHLLGELHSRKIAVGICPISNKQLIVNNGKKTPIKIYWDAGIPIVLGQDDPAVWGEEVEPTLADEYMEAGQLCNWTYEQQITARRSALHNSVLPGDSIYEISYPARGGFSYTIKEEFAECCNTSWEPSEKVNKLINDSPKIQRQIYFELTRTAFEYVCSQELKLGHREVSTQQSRLPESRTLGHVRENDGVLFQQLILDSSTEQPSSDLSHLTKYR